MGNVEEDIAQEGNANKGRALRWCLRNREGRRREKEGQSEREGRGEGEVENEDRVRLRRQDGKVRRELCGQEGGMRGARLKEGRSTRMVSRRSLAVWSPYSANYH